LDGTLNLSKEARRGDISALPAYIDLGRSSELSAGGEQAVEIWRWRSHYMAGVETQN
jgi:hypothetical protein